MNKDQIKEYRRKIVEVRESILDRLKQLGEGTVPPASIDNAEIALLEAKIALEESN